MKLTRHDMSVILRQFPNIKLSYEKIYHKKVYNSNIYLTIPKGKKYFAWFRNWSNFNVCFFLELDRKKSNVKFIFIKRVCFNNMLCSGKGTILYGTLFSINKCDFFNIEDIFFFKGKDITSYSQFKKINTLKILFNNYLKSIILTNNDVAFGLPIIDTNHDSLIKKIQKLPYTLYAIQHRLLHVNRTFLNEKINIVPHYEFIFIIKATIYPDIYELYYTNGKKYIYYKHACITDYKNSVYMNSIFRNIKENDDLDKLEESDDEEEFENIAEDKYVDLKKEISFKCVYLKYYKSWKPLVQMNGDICHEKDILNIEKYNNK